MVFLCFEAIHKEHNRRVFPYVAHGLHVFLQGDFCVFAKVLGAGVLLCFSRVGVCCVARSPSWRT